MRLGGPIDEKQDPAAWVAAIKRAGYRAAYCPLAPGADAATIRAFAAAAAAADIAIAEVGAWSNPLSPDAAERAKALAKCKGCLALADQIGACCCVNIAGSCGAKWDGPCPADLTPATFDLIVASVREIIDAVKPVRTFYTLETMPWMYPDSTETYAALVAAIDRKAFAVHFDPVNLVNSPERCFRNGDLIQEFIARLGPAIKSVHLKDIVLHDNLTVHLAEARPGTGALDYRTLLQKLAPLGSDLPIMLEHLRTAEEYQQAADHVRSVAAGLSLCV